MRAIIPARGGSSRIPRKNLAPVGGVPMLGLAIHTAIQSGLFGKVYVSTDDVEIAKVADSFGAYVIERPGHLAKNEVGTQEVMRHAVKALNLKLETEVCCIYATTPLLTAGDLHKAHALLVADTSLNYVVAVGAKPLRDLGWFYMGYARYFANDTDLYGPRTKLHVIEESRAIDINTDVDLAQAVKVYEQMRRKAA